MQRLDGQLVLSATDLVGYLACDHLATLELARVAGLRERPHRRDDPTIEIIQEKGHLHERAYLDALRARGKRVVEIEKADLRTLADLRRAAGETLEAMRSGADVVYQATFFDGRWRGHADFLFRRDDRPSPVLGAFSYDVADTKLARAVKAGAVLQLCVYAALLEAMQGIAPEYLTVVTGDRNEHRHRADDFTAYFRYVRRRFEERVARDAEDPLAAGTFPNPVEHCRVCPWTPDCIQQRRDVDHLSLVAGMRRVDTERLTAGGLPTLATLATAAPGATVPEMPHSTFERLRNQARLQLHERTTGERVYELVEPGDDPDTRGLGILPEPTPWDVFFDIEADPWAGDDGLEYLLGVVTIDTGTPEYRPIWATSPEAEATALAEFLSFVIARLDAHPGMHVYHYGGYESGALKRLVGRHNFGADALDRLLRGDILVDLLNVVRQGIRASVESYSLKQIEKFYLPAREGPVTDAGFSVVEFERWLRERDETILDGIAAYNRDDCVSTYLLREWLEARRLEAMERWPDRDWNRPEPDHGEPSENLSEWLRIVAHREAALTAGLDPADDGEDARARRLLAGLLDWHRREEKSQWWRWFELTEDLSLDALVDARDALAGLEFVAQVGTEKKSVILRYRFAPQDHPFGPGDEAYDTSDGERTGTVVDIDDLAGTIDIKRAASSERPHPQALVKSPPIPQEAMKQALLRVVDEVLAHGLGDGFAYPAIADLLARRPPRLEPPQVPGAPLAPEGADIVAVARDLGMRLRGGVLPIQGPPGTGKTYTAARMITALVRAGKRVGITAQSHRTISNLVEEVLRAADTEPEPTRLDVVQRCGDLDPYVRDERVTLATDNAGVTDALAAGASVVAGTSWLLARKELERKLDVLFVDEAGQYSLANVVAAATCADSIVLVGDPNQLPMVTQGVHPEGANVSGLAHLLGSDATIAPDRGLFLGTTRRLHPLVNTFISDAFYEGRLEAHPSTTRVVTPVAVVDAADPLAGAGVRWLPVVHSGNAARSAQEAEIVADAVARLVGRQQVGPDGTGQAIALEDVIVLAPYNAQVAEIQKALRARFGTTGNVGTVDRFQGREGVVAIYSMASSSRDDAPRDMGFLYSRNRLNVAVSRAESIALVVASPKLLEAGARTPEQMRLLDALCRYLEVAGEQAGEVGGPGPPAEAVTSPEVAVAGTGSAGG
ncbi:MAG TPA: TM0106 family RecB-like putative nuclease [Candidatus Binatia bacterium]|nr:TM0106 family RecB-like putative nuclease [Candidatus Binatia bacterium]